MHQIYFDLTILERYIHGSLQLTEKDAPSAAVLCCSIMEFLGRLLRIHIIEKGKKIPHREWFYDFIEKYLRIIDEKYYTQRSILWKIVRNESAHAMFAQSAIVWSNAEWIKNYHMLGSNDPRNSKKSLLLWTSKFVQNIDASVSIFFNDVKNDKELEKNCQKSFLEIYEYGQKIINKEIDEGILKIDIEAEVNPG